MLLPIHNYREAFKANALLTSCPTTYGVYKNIPRKASVLRVTNYETGQMDYRAWYHTTYSRYVEVPEHVWDMISTDTHDRNRVD